MSLATRCTSCGTVFRVVQDQLKVSEGWVRCGRCNEVFNALEGLFDLGRDDAALWADAPSRGPAGARSGTTEAPSDLEEPQRDPLLVDKIDAQLLSPRRSGFGALAELTPAERRHEDFADARFDTEPPSDGGDLSLAALPQAPAPATPDSGDDELQPAFVRDADQQARWRGSPARAVLAGVVGLLSLTLVLQIGHHHRDLFAVRWLPLRPALSAWCELAGCTLSAPRRIADVVVESTALTRAPHMDAFRLSVVLRNRATMPVALPWIDLSLTDAAGQLVARRALQPHDFRVESPALAAGSELALQALMAVGSGRVTGYTVEIFYP
jgi:predicted Zn finger-like uncharacterized protein